MLAVRRSRDAHKQGIESQNQFRLEHVCCFSKLCVNLDPDFNWPFFPQETGRMQHHTSRQALQISTAMYTLSSADRWMQAWLSLDAMNFG